MDNEQICVKLFNICHLPLPPPLYMQVKIQWLKMAQMKTQCHPICPALRPWYMDGKISLSPTIQPLGRNDDSHSGVKERQ